MPQAAKKKPEAWQKANRALRAACHSRGLDDDTRKSVIKEVTGKTSSSKCSATELFEVLDHINGSQKKYKATTATKKKVDSPHAKKIRALWVSLYWLGVIEDRKETAIEQFVKDQCKIDSFKWLHAGDSYKVIEALKAMATREMNVSWSSYKSPTGPIQMPELRVLEAQWAFLNPTIKGYEFYATLDDWGRKFLQIKDRKQSLIYLPTKQISKLIVELGKKVREAKGK